jgi:hypothetical protein
MHIVEGDPELPFFEQNPELRYFPEIARLIAKHGETKAGHFMWATYMFEDPRSKMYKMPIDEKTQIIQEEYLSNKIDIGDLKEIEEVRQFYPRLILTKTQILYKGYADRMDELNVYNRSLNFDTHGDKIISNLEKMTKMWTTYEKICEKMEEEDQVTTQTRKGIKESYREKRSVK